MKTTFFLALLFVLVAALIAFSGCVQPPEQPPAAGGELQLEEAGDLTAGLEDMGDLQAALGDSAIEDSGIDASSFSD